MGSEHRNSTVRGTQQIQAELKLMNVHNVDATLDTELGITTRKWRSVVVSSDADEYENHNGRRHNAKRMWEGKPSEAILINPWTSTCSKTQRT